MAQLILPTGAVLDFPGIPADVLAGHNPPGQVVGQPVATNPYRPVTNVGGTAAPTSQTALPSLPSTSMMPAVTVDDPGGYVAAMKAASVAIYGSYDLGVTRVSSAALENEASGIRFGTMERIVLPPWMRDQAR